MRRALIAVLGILLSSAAVWSAPTPAVCRFTNMHSHTISPSDLILPVALTSPVVATVQIDAAAGTIEMDGATIDVPPYDMPFADAKDTIDFADQPYRGTIDNQGNVELQAVSFKFCTLGAPAGTVCVPGNACANDVSKPCVPGFVNDNGCTGGATCQGVCSTNRAQSCADDTECPGGYCGNGFLVPFVGDMKTASQTLLGLTETGSALDFATGSMTLAMLIGTPRETPIIGEGQPTSFFMTCTLDPIPSKDGLPPAPSWAVESGRVTLGRGGATAADDKLSLRGRFIAGVSDFTTDDVVVTLGTATNTVVSLRIPAGLLKGNKRGTRFKLHDAKGVVQVTPPGTGKVVHTVLIKRQDPGYALKLSSKNLRLDALTAGQVESRVSFGIKSAAATRTAQAKGRGVAF